jgi:hypothetical protein
MFYVVCFIVYIVGEKENLLVTQVNGCSTIRCPEYTNNTNTDFQDAQKIAAESDLVVVTLGLAFDEYCLFPPGPPVVRYFFSFIQHCRFIFNE